MLTLGKTQKELKKMSYGLKSGATRPPASGLPQEGRIKEKEKAEKTSGEEQESIAPRITGTHTERKPPSPGGVGGGSAGSSRNLV